MNPPSQLLAGELLERLKQRGRTLAVAESCTGGLIGAALTAIPGSSAVFLGGVIVYSNDMKQRLLDVAREILLEHGAVSVGVVEAMADGTCRLTGATHVIAVSGIAGPDGGTVAKPVGLVCVGVHTPSGTRSFEHRFSGSRDEVRQQALEAALRHTLELLD